MVEEDSLHVWQKQDAVKALHSKLLLFNWKHIEDGNGALYSTEAVISAVMSSNSSGRMQYKGITRVHGEESMQDGEAQA